MKMPPNLPSNHLSSHSNIQSYAKDDITNAILSLLKENPTASQVMIARLLDVNVNSLKYLIRKLRREGKIERVGTSQKERWIVK